MWSFLTETRVRWLGVFWCALIIGGLFAARWVRVLPSVGIAGLFLTSVGYAWQAGPRAGRRTLGAMLSLGLVWLLHLATGLLHTSPTNPDLWQDLVLESPFLLLPVAFWLLPPWRPAHVRFLWLLLLACCLVAAAGSTLNYLLHQEAVEEIYLHSKVMPTTPDHIRFSLLVSMAVVAGLELLASRTLGPWLRRLVLAGVVGLFVFQHLLAVRSGLVTLYGAGVLWLGWLGWHYGRWWQVLQVVVLAAVLAGGSLLCFPTLQNRIANTREDASQLASVESANNYSVTARYYSYQVAYAVIGDHPLLGVSKVKLDAAMADEYSYMYPAIEQEHYLLPHNQFIFNLAAYGWLGLAVFVLAFYYPLWWALRTGKAVLVLIYAIISASFLVEYTLETQIGVVTGLFFLLLAALPVAPEQPAAEPSRRAAKPLPAAAA